MSPVKEISIRGASLGFVLLVILFLTATIGGAGESTPSANDAQQQVTLKVSGMT